MSNQVQCWIEQILCNVSQLQCHFYFTFSHFTFELWISMFSFVYLLLVVYELTASMRCGPIYTQPWCVLTPLSINVNVTTRFEMFPQTSHTTHRTLAHCYSLFTNVRVRSSSTTNRIRMWSALHKGSAIPEHSKLLAYNMYGWRICSFAESTRNSVNFDHQERTAINTVPQRARASVEKQAIQSKNQNKRKRCLKNRYD